MTTAETGRPRRVYRGTGITWWYVAALLALLALVALVVQNDDRVEFEWLWFDLHASLAALLLATAALTALLVSIGGLIWRARRRHVLARRDDARRDEVVPPPRDDGTP
jgi:uncharacterized integral membrane protein